MSLSQREIGLTKQKTAEFLGVSVRQLHRYTEKGMPRQGSGKRVRYGPAAFAWHREYEAQQNQTGRMAGTLAEEQARKIKIDADRAQLKLLREQSELVTVATVREKMEQINAFIKARVLAFPGKMAPIIAGLESKAEIKSKLTDGVYDLLTILAEGPKGKRNQRGKG